MKQRKVTFNAETEELITKLTALKNFANWCLSDEFDIRYLVIHAECAIKRMEK